MLSGLPTLQATPTGVPSLFNSIGIPLGKLPLQLLTIFPPTGYLGLNLTATGLPITSAIKAATYGAGVVAGLYASGLYINQIAKVLSYILIFAPPWYVFDCIQILTDSKFNDNGFLLPLPIPAIPSGGGKGGNWTLTFPVLSLILAATSFSGLALLNTFLPQSIKDSFGKYIEYGTGGLGILFVIVSLIAMSRQTTPGVESMVPSMPTGLPTDMTSGITSLTGGLASMIPSTMKGGGNSLPPLSTFIKDLRPQEGGSTDSVPFIGILGLIILGGFSLSYLRSKQE